MKEDETEMQQGRVAQPEIHCGAMGEAGFGPRHMTVKIEFAPLNTVLPPHYTSVILTFLPTDSNST